MKKIIIVGVIIAGLGLGIFLTKGSAKQEVSKLDVIDTVTNFYNEWLTAAKDPSLAGSSRKELAKSPILGKELRDKLEDTLKQADLAYDPVLCQTTIPEAISTRSVYERTDEAQALVTSKDKNVTEQSIVTLTRLNDGWYISGIECSLGEFAPEREFTFEREGFLLKGSIPAPYNPKDWHLIFEENGELGHVVPLFFDAESECTGLDGGKYVCKADQLVEATKVFVRGQMSERGVSVKRQEFLK